MPSVNVSFGIAIGLFTVEGATMVGALNGHYPTPVRFFMHGVVANAAFSVQLEQIASRCCVETFVLRHDHSVMVNGSTLSIMRLLAEMKVKWPKIFNHSSGINLFVDSRLLGAIIGRLGSRVNSIKSQYRAPPVRCALTVQTWRFTRTRMSSRTTSRR